MIYDPVHLFHHSNWIYWFHYHWSYVTYNAETRSTLLNDYKLVLLKEDTMLNYKH